MFPPDSEFEHELAAHERWHRAAARVVALVCILLIVLLVACQAHAQVPQAAHAYRADLVRTARMVWGLDAPVAVFAA
ncbi:MAG TPA: hypothetical protein VN156_09345, partial [Pseudomonas sp.]|nr:hypothetical protein [Pseudomonas sp.]